MKHLRDSALQSESMAVLIFILKNPVISKYLDLDLN